METAGNADSSLVPPLFIEADGKTRNDTENKVRKTDGETKNETKITAGTQPQEKGQRSGLMEAVKMLTNERKKKNKRK